MKEARFRTTIALSLAAHILQFLLGMAVNLFVKIPTTHPGSNPPEYFGGVVSSVSWAILHGGLWLTLHAAWGLVLVLAALGFSGVLGAGFNGGSFLNYHEDFSSMLMAVGLALAMSAYVARLYRRGIATRRAEL
jgi:ABC-type amino acid transport system permease subunit